MEWSGKQLKKYLWSCERKKAYTEWESRRFVWKMKSRGHQTFNRYLCKFCGHWHVGNKQVSLAGGRESGKPTLKREAGNLRSDESCALVHNTGRLEGVVRSPGGDKMNIEARVRTPFLKPKQGWKSVDIRDAVGTLKLTATQPDDTQLLRYINQAFSPAHQEQSREIIVRIGEQEVCKWTCVAAPERGKDGK